MVAECATEFFNRLGELVVVLRLKPRRHALAPIVEPASRVAHSLKEVIERAQENFGVLGGRRRRGRRPPRSIQ
jgi:hypothetical protein